MQLSDFLGGLCLTSILLLSYSYLYDFGESIRESSLSRFVMQHPLNYTYVLSVLRILLTVSNKTLKILHFHNINILELKSFHLKCKKIVSLTNVFSHILLIFLRCVTLCLIQDIVLSTEISIWK